MIRLDKAGLITLGEKLYVLLRGMPYYEKE